MRCQAVFQIPLLWCTVLLHLLFGPSSSGDTAGQDIPTTQPLHHELEGDEIGHFVDQAADYTADEVGEVHPAYLQASEPLYCENWTQADHVKLE